MTSKLQF